MATPSAYICLTCGSKHGEPLTNASENWYWRLVVHGRVGPFCSPPCSREFRLSPDPVFTLQEWERLRFVRATNPEAQEHVGSTPAS